MKKYITIIIAVALVMGMTQCKKNVETINNVASEGVFITLKVAGDDSRHEVNPSSGKVVYKEGDKIYVGHNGAYIGTLTYGSGGFSGTITPGANNDYLYFYFLGGLETTPNTLSAANQSYTINISNQRENLPVLSLGRSNVPYTSEVTTYTSQLLNQCALVKFTLTEATPSLLDVDGMLVEAAINFANHSITPTTTTGTIQLRTQTLTDRWAIMLPQAAVTGATATIVNGDSYTVDIPAITANGYITSGIVIDNSTPVFTVDGNGTTVHFSKGNLRYISSVNSWCFADHQYDVCQTSDGTWNTSGMVDLFGWGTWGNGKNPLNTSTNPDDYQWSTDFTGIFDGHSWRTLTKDEWQYIFDHSTYGMATITVNNQDVHGTVILPDNSSLTINTDHSAWSNNTYTASEWDSDMDTNGAIFLPAAGFRRGGTSVEMVGVLGAYWTSTIAEGVEAYGLGFLDDGEYCGVSIGTDDRDRGCNVRLVR